MQAQAASEARQGVSSTTSTTTTSNTARTPAQYTDFVSTNWQAGGGPSAVTYTGDR